MEGPDGVLEGRAHQLWRRWRTFIAVQKKVDRRGVARRVVRLEADERGIR
jgi:hypothetical protein